MAPRFLRGGDSLGSLAGLHHRFDGPRSVRPVVRAAHRLVAQLLALPVGGRGSVVYLDSLSILPLTRLGVDTRAQRRGVGTALLRHVLHLACQQSDALACVGVVTEAKPQAAAFCESFGSVPPEGMSEGDLTRGSHAQVPSDPDGPSRAGPQIAVPGAEARCRRRHKSLTTLGVHGTGGHEGSIGEGGRPLSRIPWLGRSLTASVAPYEILCQHRRALLVGGGREQPGSRPVR